MKKFSELVIRYRVLVVVLVVLISGAAGYLATGLKVESDMLNYLPPHDPHVVLFKQIGEKFKGNYLGLVALETTDVFNYQTLSRIRELTEAYEQVEGVGDVSSLTNILDIKKIEGGVEVGKLIDRKRIPDDPEDLKRLRDYTLSKEMYRGSLVSEDGGLTVIICRLKEDVDKFKVAEELKGVTKSIPGPEKVYYAGIPFQMISITEIIYQDLKLLFPIVVLVVGLVLFFSFRNLWGVVLPMVTVLISTIWMLGLMRILGFPITMVSNATPILLVAVGIAYCIHFLRKHEEEVALGLDRKESVRKAIEDVGIPIVMAGLTTLIGFLSFLTSDLSLLREFGILTAFGIFSAMALSLSFSPAILSFIKTRSRSKGEGKSGENDSDLLGRLSRRVIRHRREALILGAVVIIVSVSGIPRITREVNMVEYFKEGNEIRVTEEIMEQKLGGSIPIQIVVRADIKDPAVLSEMFRIEKFIDSLPYVNNAQSMAALIAEMNYTMNDHYSVPETREGIGNLWFMLEGESMLDLLVDHDAQEGMIQASLANTNTKVIKEVVKKVNDFIEKDLAGEYYSVRLAEIPAGEQQKLKEKLVERVVENIIFDAANRASEIRLDRESLEACLLSGMKDKSLKPDPDLVQKLEERLMNYFTSDEADIQIKSEETIKNIISSLLIPFQEGGILNEDEIKQILNRILKEKASEYYEEDMDYASQSLSDILNNYAQWIPLQHYLKALKPLIPARLWQEGDFQKDLVGDLWELNQGVVPLSPEEFADLHLVLSDQREPVQLEMKQTGMPVIYDELDEKILKSQYESLVLALIVVFILLAIQFRSLIGGLIGIVPICLCVLINFAVMGYFRITLDQATVGTAAVAIGIGIDYAIHFLARFKREYLAWKNEALAIELTSRTAGRAILINAFSVMMGFLVFLFGTLIPMQHFGILLALTMITSSLSALIIIPALLLTVGGGFIGRIDKLLNTLKKKADEISSTIKLNNKKRN